LLKSVFLGATAIAFPKPEERQPSKITSNSTRLREKVGRANSRE